MAVLIYFLLGLISSIIGALPLGTTNVAVINTTLRESIHNGLKIVYTAAIAEVLLVLIALNFNMQIEYFIGMNIWLQYAIALLLLVVGLVLFIGRKECITDENEECIIIKKKRFNPSKQLLGFILGLVNPTVLIYWILVISFLRKKMIYLDIGLEYDLLIVFLIGVFSGKSITLYGYGKFSHSLKQKKRNNSLRVNRVIGLLLLGVSIFQFGKLLYF